MKNRNSSLKVGPLSGIACRIAHSTSIPLLVLTLLVLAGNHALAQDDALIQRVYAEAPAKWRELDAATAELQADVHETAIDHSTGKTIFDVEHQYRQTETCAFGLSKIIAGGGASPGSFTVTCANPRYAFVLDKKSADADWVLRNGTSDTSGEIESGFRIAETCRKIVTAAKHLECQQGDLLHLFDAGLFKVRSAREENGRIVIAFDFPDSVGSDDPTMVVGTMTLDPANYWLIRQADFDIVFAASFEEAEARTAANTIGHFAMTYDWVLGEAGIPLMTSMEIRSTGDGPLKINTSARRTYRVWKEEISPSEFELTAFGIDLPEELKEPPRVWLWLTITGISCIVVLLLIRSVRRAKMK